MARVSRMSGSYRGDPLPSLIRQEAIADGEGRTAPQLPRRTVMLGMLAGGLSLLSVGSARADAPAAMPVPRSAGGVSSPASPSGQTDATATPNDAPPPRATGTPVGAGLSPTPVIPKPRGNPVTVGVYIPGAAQDTTLLDAFEGAAGKRMAIVHWYQPWGYTKGWYSSPLDVAALNAVAARGATPMVTWEAWGPIDGVDPSHVANIPTGAFDAYIDAWAQGLKTFGKPVYLRLFHEMNNQSYPWAYGTNGNTAQDLIAAWRYVHGRFARIGAANVRWVWSPNTENDLVAFADLYPGDAYVDWFGVDGYNGGSLLAWGGWLPAQQLFDRSYRAFHAINPSKPVMIAEIGSVEQGGSKPDWITDLFTATLPRAFPNIRAVVWFDDNLSDQGQADWRVESSQVSLHAFGQAVASL